MKNFITTIILFNLLLTVNGQIDTMKIENYTKSSIYFHEIKKSDSGLLIFIDLNKNILGEGIVINGKKHGVWKEYYGGKLKSEVRFRHDTLINSKYYYQDTTIIKSESYCNNLGIIKIYIEKYKDGKLKYLLRVNNLWKEEFYWYANGSLRSSFVSSDTICENNLISLFYKKVNSELQEVGFKNTWYKDGTIMSTVSRNGRDLIVTYFRNDASKISKETYRIDILKMEFIANGRWLYWDENEKIINEEVYKNGRLIE